ncbi:hypothetical protein I7I51_02426 [Histoplasma capsulatum]|uniref:Uncharacterized protein n=1 Tax=Ajellomyces capsulatus TaxID=5037 RepID=A0A8A1MEX3_AJECA|nr:hypothetical protein I7I51_02426 [Histoplasma capsulatum]
MVRGIHGMKKPANTGYNEGRMGRGPADPGYTDQGCSQTATSPPRPCIATSCCTRPSSCSSSSPVLSPRELRERVVSCSISPVKSAALLSHRAVTWVLLS